MLRVESKSVAIQKSFLNAVKEGDVRKVAKYVEKYGDKTHIMNAELHPDHGIFKSTYYDHALISVTDNILRFRNTESQNKYIEVLYALLKSKVISLACTSSTSTRFQPLLHHILHSLSSRHDETDGVYAEIILILLNDARTYRNVKYRGMTPFHVAIQSKLNKCAMAFASDRKVDVNAQSTDPDFPEQKTQSPLMMAILNNMNEVAIKLLNDRPDLNINLTTHNGNTALDYAISTHNTEIALQILSRKDLISEDDHVNLPSLLMFALQERVTEEVLDAIMARPETDVNKANALGFTPLMQECSAGRSETVRKLLARNEINTLAKEDSNQNALMYAAWEGNSEIVDLLLRRSEMTAEVLNTKSNSQHTALLLAARRNHQECALQLINTEKCELNTANADGDTALIFAVRNRNYKLAKSLLEKGADPNVINNAGENALDEAVKIRKIKRCSRIVDLLLAHGAEIDPVNPKTGISAAELAMSSGNNAIALRLLRREHGLQKTITILDHSMFKKVEPAAKEKEENTPEAPSIQNK